MWSIPAALDTLPDIHCLAAGLEAHADFFDRAAPLLVGRAPGRLDVMGGFADYSGGLVLEAPLSHGTYAVLQPDPDPLVRVRSAAMEAEGRPAEFAIPLPDLIQDGQPASYETVRARLAGSVQGHWAAYAVGVLCVVLRELRGSLDHGLRLLIVSKVPLGKGVSSSAALEVAVMSVLTGHLGLAVDGREQAMLCQKAENLVVGAPCGVMDQMTAVFGEQGSMVALLCQPAELQSSVALPDEIGLWAIDSGIRHAITGADYTSVRIGTYMGYRIIASLAGLGVEPLETGQVRVQDPHWNGYLVNISPSEYASRFCSHLPETIGGREFLAHYHGTTDRVTQVDPSRIYAVRRPVEHPVYEQQRVQLVRALFRYHDPDESIFQLIGEMMYQAHESYNACNIGSEGTDRLVALARMAGPRRGVYGAKITGGGSGGFVAILGRADAGRVIEEIAAQYRAETGKGGEVLFGSSDGARAVGIHTLTP